MRRLSMILIIPLVTSFIFAACARPAVTPAPQLAPEPEPATVPAPTLEPTSVEGYQDISLKGLTVTIPAEWREDELSPEMLQAIAESKGSVNSVKYQDEGFTIDFALTVIDMEGWCELSGDSWHGWEEFPELTGATNQEYVEWFSYSGLVNSENIVVEGNRTLTINDREACEILYSAEIQGIPVFENYLFMFHGDKLGIVFAIIKDTTSSAYSDCWPAIRDSTRLD